MNLERLPYDTSALVDFYEEGLSALGAICERSWHDRLQLIAEGPSARLWCPNGALTELELSFPSPESADARDAERQVFPGCPLTFRLVEALRETMARPAVKDKLEELGNDTRIGPPAEFRTRVEQDLARWRPLAHVVGQS